MNSQDHVLGKLVLWQIDFHQMGFQLIGFSEVVMGYFGKLTYFFNLCMLLRPSLWKLSIGHLGFPTSQMPS